MKLVIFTSNSIRHKFVANSLAKEADDTLVVSECTLSEMINNKVNTASPIQQHFMLRSETEQKFFEGNNYFIPKTLPLLYKEASLDYTYEIIKNFEPDLMIVFGSSVLKGPLLSLIPGRFVNLHLGLSPYYRGSGTNFWPFVNEELEYVGATILHIDPGIDTGDIICHIIPEIKLGDNVHTIGCKVIRESVNGLSKIIEMVRSNKELKREKQWNVDNPKYYKSADFNESTLKAYQRNLKNGLIEKFLSSKKHSMKIIPLD